MYWVLFLLVMVILMLISIRGWMMVSRAEWKLQYQKLLYSHSLLQEQLNRLNENLEAVRGQMQPSTFQFEGELLDFPYGG